LGRGVRRPRRSDVLRLVALGIWGNVVYQFLFIFGVSETSAGNASLLLSTTPVWAALLSTAAGHERPGPRVWQGVSLAVLGMVLVDNSRALARELELRTSRGIVVQKASGVASQNRIKPFDVILGVNRTEINSVEQFRKIISEKEQGSYVFLYINRFGQEFYAKFVLPE